MKSNLLKKAFLVFLPVIVVVGSLGFVVEVEASVGGVQEDLCGKVQIDCEGHQMPMQDCAQEEHCLRCYTVDAVTSAEPVMYAPAEIAKPVVHVARPKQQQTKYAWRPKKAHKYQRLKEHLSVQPRE